MKRRFGTRVATLFTLLAMPALLAAQGQEGKHKRYTLVDLGTFGGANSNFQGGAVVINDRGTATGSAETAVVDPILGPVFHTFRWDHGLLTDLGTLPEGALSIGQAINSPGVVAGASTTGVMDPIFGPEFVATIWKKNGDIVDLGTLGGAFSITNAINNRGQAVGGATNTIPDPDNFGAAVTDLPKPTQWHAALWQDGTIQDLGTLGDGTVSFALFVNEHGQVTGVSTTDTTPTLFGIPTLHPFFWEEGRGLVDVGTLGGVYSAAAGLNERGQVVGFSTLAGDETNHAFLWDKGVMRDLGTLGGTQSAATAINDRSEIVGEAFPVAEHIHAFLWRNGVMADLGTVASCDDSIATSINSNGQVVGEAFGCETSSHAFLWENGGPAIDLNELVPPGSELFLVEAQFINDRGEIAGLGVLPNGDGHAFLLIPGGPDAGAAEGVTITSSLAAVIQTSTNLTRSSLTPENRVKRRSLSSNRHRGLALAPPGKAD